MNFVLRIALLFAVTVSSAFADEGMWTLDNLPKQQLKQKYDFVADSTWAEHVMHASVRVAQGCSGSFVSGDGLVMTNHHCAVECLQGISNPNQDYMAKGFTAAKRENEVHCPNVELNQLTSITDVTSKVSQFVANAGGAERIKKEREIESQIEHDCVGSEGGATRCDVVTLYHGGRYALYKYRRYQDIRLVFAPEQSIAFFGGDPDNFNFPRYDLDVTFLRAYVDGKPAHTEFFKFNASGPKAGDLVFTAGHPGGTERLFSAQRLENLRTVDLTGSYGYLSELRGVTWQYGSESGEHYRQVEPALFFEDNSLKVTSGLLETLNDDRVIADRRNSDRALLDWIKADPARLAKYGDPTEAEAGALRTRAALEARYQMLEAGYGFRSRLFGFARAIVRGTAEHGKPDATRLPEYRDANLPAVEQRLFSQAPIYPELEVATLSWSLEKARQYIGPDDPFIHDVYGSQSPRAIATNLIEHTTLADPAVRKALWENKNGEVERSQDPLILFAKQADPYARALRTQYEDEVVAVLDKNEELIAQARFERDGANAYPDATFTLRVSYGIVQGWDEGGKPVPPFTTMGGIFKRATGADPFKLPETWLAAKNNIDPNVPFNFVSTNDIIGGNSGSPVINRAAEVVGLAFDGNIHSIAGDYVYDAALNRSVSVDASAIAYALRHIYNDPELADELARGGIKQ